MDREQLAEVRNHLHVLLSLAELIQLTADADNRERARRISEHAEQLTLLLKGQHEPISENCSGCYQGLHHDSE